MADPASPTPAPIQPATPPTPAPAPAAAPASTSSIVATIASAVVAFFQKVWVAIVGGATTAAVSSVASTIASAISGYVLPVIIGIAIGALGMNGYHAISAAVPILEPAPKPTVTPDYVAVFTSRFTQEDAAIAALRSQVDILQKALEERLPPLKPAPQPKRTKTSAVIK